MVENIVSAPTKLVEDILVQPVVNLVANSGSSSNSAYVNNTYTMNMFLVIAILFLIFLFVWSYVTYDPDQTIFTLKNVPQNATHDFKNFSGVIIIHDGDQKGVTEWLVGGDVVRLVECSGGCSDLGNPSSGLLAFNAEINGYTWTQSKYANPTTYTFITNRINKNA